MVVALKGQPEKAPAAALSKLNKLLNEQPRADG